MLLIFIGFLAGVALADDETAMRTVGGAATTAAIAYYVAPLSTLWDVIRTRYGPFNVRDARICRAAR